MQLTQVPRAADATDALGLRRQIFAALAGAHAELLGLEAESSSIAFVCMRPRGSRRLLYAMGGHPVFPFVVDDAEGDAGDVPVLYPPGSRGCSIPAAQVEAELEKLPYWVRCVGEADILWAPEAAESRGLPSLRLPFDEYVAHLTDPFCWMVMAEPVPRDVVEAERSRLAGRIPLLRQRENSQVHRIELERTEARFRELTRSRATGLWSVRIAVGGVDPARTRRTAVLLSSASDLDDVPYVVLPGATLGSLAEMLSGREEIDGGRSPFLATSEFLGSVARPPGRELPGVRTVLPAAFDVTPEQFSADPAGILMGTVLDDALRPAGELQVSYQTLNRHTFVCGATGSGKSQTARWLLESLSTGPRRIPWLVVEPAKAEYSRMAARLGPEGRVLVIRPGELDSPPASLNPLEPEPGFPLQSHADLVRALFLAAFEANEPFPQVLSQALARCYTQAGWDLVTGRQRPATKPLFHRDDPLEPVRPRYPLLGELQSAARVVVDEIGYGREVAADVRGFVDVRIGSLRTGAPGRFFEGGHPLDVGELLSLNAVLELEPITNDQDKAFLMGAVLIRIVEHLRVRHGAAEAGELRHVLLLEEAHRLLRKVESGPAAAAVELFASLLAEIRAYGEGVAVIEQIPAKIVPDVIKNTALKVMHRLPALDDREAVGATMNLTTEQSEAVVALPPGVAALTVDGADRPLLVRMKSGVGRELGGQCNRVPPMARRRSTLCGKECLAEACNLRELNESRSRVVEPAVTVWVEAVVASMVLGIEPPGPRAPVRQTLAGTARELDCALATATDRAVDARRPVLRRWVDTDDFSVHANGVLRSRLAGEALPASDTRKWQAGYFRFVKEWLALRDAVHDLGAEAASVAPVHPDTRHWAARGLLLDATTLAGQLAEIALHPAFASTGKAPVLGDVQYSGLADALIALCGTADGRAVERAFGYACTGRSMPALFATLAGLLDGMGHA